MAGLNIEPLLELWLTNLDKLLACLYLALIVRMDMEDGKFYSVFTKNDSAYSLLIINWLNDNVEKITNALIDATFHSDFSSLSDSERSCLTDALQYFEQLN